MDETKTTNKERLREITDGIEQGIKDLFQSDRYAQYLATMSRFHKYSVNNTMLIYMQKPGATLVAGFNKWRDQFERNVKKGEKGIKIIAPTPFKKKIEEQKFDPDTHAPMINPDGTAVMEEKEVKIPMYKPVTVFDVSQTEGKPIPTLASDLTGNVERYELFFEALRRASPVPISIETMTQTMDGYFDPEHQDIAIRKGMSEVQTISAAIHEITHAKLHNYEQERLAAAAGDENAEPPKPKDRRTEEVEAESVSYAVCQYYGIQTGENSFGYIAAWSKDKELPELRASLETINKTASSLISDIDYNYRAVVKEYDVVIEAWAADFDTYLRDNTEPPFPLETGEEVIADTVQDIKRGDSHFIRSRLNQLEADGARVPDDLLRRLDAIEKNYPPREIEAVYFLDNETYLHIQEADEGFDYTLYDKGLREIDGGYIDAPNLTLASACETALANHGLTPETLEKVSLDILGEIAAVRQQAIEDYKREHNIGQPTPSTGPLPEPPEQAYHYPMPDPQLTVDDLEACGYMDGDMLPLSKDRALELYEKDLTIYMMYDGGEASMAFDTEEIESHTGIFAIPYEEWEQVREDIEPASQTMPEQAFLDASHDTYAIYQLREDKDLRDIRFEPLSWLESKGHVVERDNYTLIYTAPLTRQGSTEEKLESLWYQFNNETPGDFTGHSLSVSDIVALRQGGKVSCHYADSYGFQEVSGFLQPENYLKNAEMALEDDYGMIDGIINNGPKATVAELEQQAKSGHPISLMDLADAVHREQREKKASVLEHLKSYEPQGKSNKAAPKKSAEREI